MLHLQLKFGCKSKSHSKENGWSYLKLDFLYAGAQKGQRYTDVTGMEAYHIGMGPSSSWRWFLLACGAPMLPSLPYADAYRTGADIGFGFDQSTPRILAVASSLYNARSWQIGFGGGMILTVTTREPFDDIEVTGSVLANFAFWWKLVSWWVFGIPEKSPSLTS